VWIWKRKARDSWKIVSFIVYRFPFVEFYSEMFSQIYPVINGKELNPIIDKICAVFCNGLQEKEREKERKLKMCSFQ
jgi:hypothetical protein